MQKLGEIYLVIFSGLFVEKKGKTLDLLVISDISKEDLQDFLNTEVQDAKNIKFGILSKDDFLYRLRLNDKFIIDMLKDPDNILGLNKLKGQLSKHIE